MRAFRIFVERECTVGMWVTVEAETADHAEEAIQNVIHECAEETGGRTFPPIQHGVDLRPAWAVAVQARLGEEWRIVEDFEVRVIAAEEVSNPGTGMQPQQSD